MTIQTFSSKVEMLLMVGVFRAASAGMPIRELVRFAASLAEWLPPTMAGSGRRRSLRRAEPWARRASEFIPGATCLHRSLASRVWLARRGIPTRLVVGFRRDGGLEGHAWLEIEGAPTDETLFGDSSYRRSFGESDLLEPNDRADGSWPRTEPADEIESGRGDATTR